MGQAIGDDNQRQGNLYNLLNRWMHNDPATAASYVQNSSLSDQQKLRRLQAHP